MNLQSLKLRILGGSVATAALALLLVQATIGAAISMSDGPHEVAEVSPAVQRACAADPAAWVDVTVGHERARAYDADGRSASPEVPPLRLRRALAVGEVQRAPGGVVTRVSEGGGCAYLEVGRGPPHRDRFGAFELGATFGTFVAVLAAGLLSYAFTVTPLLRRIEALRRAAVAVGGEAYARGDDDVGDALGEIGRVLDRSHDRLLAYRAALIERHHALERHMAELAHDLRTPIGSMLLALQERQATDDDPAIRRSISDAASIMALVENLHAAARLRQGLDARGGHVDLRGVVERLEVRFRALGALDGVEVGASCPDEPVWVRCDANLAERALGNLLHNAVEHGGEHAAILLERWPDRFVVRVLDDGDPAGVGTLLAGLRDDPARPRGPGMGLDITREICRRVGWSLSASTLDEGGVEVRVEGPLGPDAG